MSEGRSHGLGRHVFGAAAVAAGVVTLFRHDDANWSQLGGAAAGVIEIFGGLAIQFRRTAGAGAAALSAVFLVFALQCVPKILAAPQVYDSWGNFFEQFALLSGAAILAASLLSRLTAKTIRRAGAVCIGVCAASFCVEQAIHLDVTSSLVPKWFPPGQMFWAVATSVFFALAAAGLVFTRTALVTARLLTAMLLIFGVLVWIPQLVSNPSSRGNWNETAETFGIAGAAWILADRLARVRSAPG